MRCGAIHQIMASLSGFLQGQTQINASLPVGCSEPTAAVDPSRAGGTAAGALQSEGMVGGGRTDRSVNVKNSEHFSQSYVNVYNQHIHLSI